MPTEKEIVDELRRFYEGGGMRQKDLAGALGLSPQQLAEILATRNRPTAGQILRIQDFLKDKTMNSIRVLPPRLPKHSTRNPNEPLTLAAAKEMLEARDAEIAALRSAATTPAKPALTVPTPTAKPMNTPRANQQNKTPMPASPRSPKLILSPDLDSPVKIQSVLDKMNLADLRLALDSEKDKLRIALLYREIQKHRELVNQ